MKGILTGCADHNLHNTCSINGNLKKKKEKRKPEQIGKEPARERTICVSSQAAGGTHRAAENSMRFGPGHPWRVLGVRQVKP